MVFITPFPRCRKPNWLIGQVEVSVCPILLFLPHSGSNFRCCKAQIPGINLLLEKVHMKKRATFFVTLKKLFRIIAGNKSYRKENYSLVASAVNSITEIKNTEQKLKESEEKYSSLFEQALDGFGISDFNGKVLDVNQSMCRMSGYSKEELLQMHVTGFIDPQELKTTPLRLEAIKKGERVSGLRKIKRKDGSIVEVEINAQKIGEDRFFTIARDLTDIRTAEHKIALSEATFKTAFEHSAIGMAFLTPEGVFQQVNKELGKITGYKETELCQLNYRQITHADDIEEEEHGVNELKKGIIDVYKTQKRYIHKNGEIVWANLSLSVVRNPDGSPGYMVAFVEDITKQINMSALLQESEEKNRLILNAALDCIISIDTNSIITYWNKQSAVVFGWSSEEAVGRPLADMIIPANLREAHKKGMARYLTTGQETVLNRMIEITAINNEGKEFPIELTITPVKQNDILSFTAFIRDITNRKKAEQELKRSEETNRAIVNAFPDKIFRIKRNGVILDNHTSDEKKLDIHSKIYEGKHITEVVPYEAATVLMVGLENAFESNQVITLEYELPVDRKDRFYEGRIVAMTNGEALLIARDITGRKMAGIEIEKRNYEIKERIKELRTMYQVSELSTRSDISMTQMFEDVTHIIPSAYQYPEIASVRIFYNKEVFVSENFDQSEWIQDALIMVDGKPVGKIEVFYSEERPQQYESVFLKEERGLINSVAQMLSSAIERRMAISELMESEEKFRSLVEQDYVGVYILQDKAFVYVNKGFEKISGYSYQQLVHNMSFENLIHADDLLLAKENYNNRVTGKKDNDQYVIKAIRSDGAIRHIELIVSRLMYKGSPAIIGTIIDVTDRVEEETRIGLAITETQERERLEMGMELHDNVKQILATSQLHIDIAKQYIKEGKDPNDILSKTREIVGDAIFEIRQLSHQLAPVVDADADFCEVIRTLLKNINHDQKLKLKLELDCLDNIASRDVQVAIYRIIQEQFANIKKHADATIVKVTLKQEKTDIVLQIKDDGKGFEKSKHKTGIGLENIKRRAQILGGSVQIKSMVGEGCEMTVLLKNPIAAG